MNTFLLPFNCGHLQQCYSNGGGIIASLTRKSKRPSQSWSQMDSLKLMRLTVGMSPALWSGAEGRPALQRRFYWRRWKYFSASSTGWEGLSGEGQKLSDCSSQTFHKNYNYNPYKDLSHLSFYALVWRHLVIVSAPFYAARHFPSPQRAAPRSLSLQNKRDQFLVWKNIPKRSVLAA